jgi:ribosome recycling factor
MDIKKIIADGANAMKKAVDHTSHEFATLHTGKASPGMIENVQVHIESYGMTQRLKDMAAITTPDAQTMRCPVPSLSGERRLELAKRATQMAEEGKVRVRNARRDALELLKKGNKEKTVTDDDLKRSEKEIQTHTDKFTADIEKNLKAKEADLKG